LEYRIEMLESLFQLLDTLTQPAHLGIDQLVKEHRAGSKRAQARQAVRHFAGLRSVLPLLLFVKIAVPLDVNSHASTP
jgi:hypothetical protein